MDWLQIGCKNAFIFLWPIYMLICRPDNIISVLVMLICHIAIIWQVFVLKKYLRAKFLCPNFLYSTQDWRCIQLTVETAFYDHPLVQQKNSLKRQVVWETRVGMTCPCKVKDIFWTVTRHLQPYSLISYIFAVRSLHKRWFLAYTSLQQGYNVYSAVVPYSRYILTTETFLYRVMEISVLKSRRSLATKIVKTIFNCTCYVPWKKIHMLNFRTLWRAQKLF